MSISRITAVALAAVFSLGSMAGVASARDVVTVRVATPHKAHVRTCHVERTKIRSHGKVIWVKKRVCDHASPVRHHR